MKAGADPADTSDTAESSANDEAIMPPELTSPYVMATVSTATIALVYAYVCQIRQESTARRVRDWVRDTYPEVWVTLNWVQQHAMGGTIGLKKLRDGALSDDDAFRERYARVTRLDRHKLIATAVGALGIGLAILGTLYWGWNW